MENSLYSILNCSEIKKGYFTKVLNAINSTEEEKAKELANDFLVVLLTRSLDETLLSEYIPLVKKMASFFNESHRLSLWTHAFRNIRISAYTQEFWETLSKIIQDAFADIGNPSAKAEHFPKQMPKFSLLQASYYASYCIKNKQKGGLEVLEKTIIPSLAFFVTKDYLREKDYSYLDSISHLREWFGLFYVLRGLKIYLKNTIFEDFMGQLLYQHLVSFLKDVYPKKSKITCKKYHYEWINQIIYSVGTYLDSVGKNVEEIANLINREYINRFKENEEFYIALRNQLEIFKEIKLYKCLLLDRSESDQSEENERTELVLNNENIEEEEKVIPHHQQHSKATAPTTINIKTGMVSSRQTESNNTPPQVHSEGFNPEKKQKKKIGENLISCQAGIVKPLEKLNGQYVAKDFTQYIFKVCYEIRKKRPMIWRSFAQKFHYQ